MSDTKNIYAAFVKAQTGFAPALKTSTNPHFKSKYADLAACIEAVMDSLNANGIGLVQKTHLDETGVTVETVFVHTSGESFSGGALHVPAAKQDPQGYGSALSYARRYSLMAACGHAPEDDDGNAGSKRPQASPSKSPRRILTSPDPNTGDVAWVEEEPKVDMSPKARADRMRIGVAAGDAAGVAETLSLLPQAEMEAIMNLWPQETYDKVVAAWPKVPA